MICVPINSLFVLYCVKKKLNASGFSVGFIQVLFTDLLLFSSQGFQVLCDLADGFAGLGSKVTEMLQDSYGGRGILTWGLAPVSHPDSVSHKLGHFSVYWFVRGCLKADVLKMTSVLMLFFLFNQTPMKDIYHMLNCSLGTVHLANHSSFFCPLTLRGGLGRRPTSPIAFPHLNYDVSL